MLAPVDDLPDAWRVGVRKWKQHIDEKYAGEAGDEISALSLILNVIRTRFNEKLQIDIIVTKNECRYGMACKSKVDDDKHDLHNHHFLH